MYEFGDGDDDYFFYFEDILWCIYVVFYEMMDSIRLKFVEEVKNILSIVKYCFFGIFIFDIKVIVIELCCDVLCGVNIVFIGVIFIFVR